MKKSVTKQTINSDTFHFFYLAHASDTKTVLSSPCDVHETFRGEWTFRWYGSQDPLGRKRHFFQGRGRTSRQETVVKGTVRRRRDLCDPSERDRIVHSLPTATSRKAVSSRRSGVESVIICNAGNLVVLRLVIGRV